MRSIHSCKCAETCSLSRAIRCLCTKSIGVLAQGGSFTEPDESRTTSEKIKRNVQEIDILKYRYRKIASFRPLISGVIFC